jgi:hypothetical protein
MARGVGRINSQQDHHVCAFPGRIPSHMHHGIVSVVPGQVIVKRSPPDTRAVCWRRGQKKYVVGRHFGGCCLVGDTTSRKQGKTQNYNCFPHVSNLTKKAYFAID